MWNEVMYQFRDRADPIGVIHRLSEEWAVRFGLEYEPVGPHSHITKEKWGHEQVREHLERISRVEPRMRTDLRPRRLDGAIVLLDFGQGRVGQIDGRRRANVWKDRPGQYDILRIRC